MSKPDSNSDRSKRASKVLKHIEEKTGPMNSVAKDDARVYTEQHAEKHSLTKVQKEKMLRAKKRKIQRSTTKEERALSKQIKRYFDK